MAHSIYIGFVEVKRRPITPRLHFTLWPTAPLWRWADPRKGKWTENVECSIRSGQLNIFSLNTDHLLFAWYAKKLWRFLKSIILAVTLPQSMLIMLASSQQKNGKLLCYARQLCDTHVVKINSARRSNITLHRLTCCNCFVLALVVVDFWHRGNKLNKRNRTSTSASPTVFEKKDSQEESDGDILKDNRTFSALK